MKSRTADPKLMMIGLSSILISVSDSDLSSSSSGSRPADAI
jgi:hypothetical protein